MRKNRAITGESIVFAQHSPTMIDSYDRQLLDALQHNCLLTNAELADIVHLSPSQCSRRRTRLEAEGVIARSTAILDRDRVGLELLTFVFVTLSTHSRDNAREFAGFVRELPEVLECHALTGEMDYLLKIVSRDLKSLSVLVNERLLVHPAVQHVKTAVALDTLKESTVVPVGH